MEHKTTQELNSARLYYRNEVIPKPSRAIMDAETARLADSGLFLQARWLGKTVKDFILPDIQGRSVRLYSLLEEGPVILTFYRGGWCPYCNIALRGLQRELPRFRALGAQLIAVSPQLPDESLTTAEKNGLEFPVLSDAGNHVARQLGLCFKLSSGLTELYQQFKHPLEKFNGNEGSNELPVPATFLISTDHTVLRAFVNVDYTKRMEPEDIVAALTTMRQE